MPLFTKGDDPKGIAEDRNHPIGTGMTEVCLNPANGGLYQIAVFSNNEANQTQLRAYHQPGPHGDYRDNGIVFHLPGGVNVPPQPVVVEGYFPAQSSLPPDTREVRP